MYAEAYSILGESGNPYVRYNYFNFSVTQRTELPESLCHKYLSLTVMSHESDLVVEMKGKYFSCYVTTCPYVCGSHTVSVLWESGHTEMVPKKQDFPIEIVYTFQSETSI